MAETNVRVLYIAGAGRSGSTLVARILGQVPGLISVGEVRHVLHLGYLSLPRDVRCGCGEAFASCPFWTAVREQVDRSPSAIDVNGLPGLLRRVDRIRYLPAIYSPWKSSSFISRLAEAKRALRAIYEVILRVGGAQVVVDESKDLSLLYLLADMPDVDLDLLHLVRDGRAVANSHMRRRRRPEFVASHQYMKQFGPFRASQEWWYRNLGVEAARLLVNRYQRVRYEDLVEQPRERLRLVLDGFGYDNALSHLENHAVHIVESDHLGMGNPSRFQRGRIEIRPDLRWRSEMPATRRRLVTTLVWPLLLRYRYPILVT